MSETIALSVSQLNTYVKGLIESDERLKSVYVVGEISNFTNHYKSGHLYMSLKDDNAVIKAVMFRSSASRLKFEPANGMRVICRGRVSLYEASGSYQFYIEDMQPDGVGALQMAYEQLCNKLREQGLFDESHKKPLPKYPDRVAVITSPTGAAVQDIINIITRRSPLTQIVMCPVLVQGENAAAQLIKAVIEVNDLNCADVIIIGRGGGSLEDLWAFNDERLAYTIFKSDIPVISAVGHETDFTICDFVADMRAPTPSAAAELAVADRMQTLYAVRSLSARSLAAVNGITQRCKGALETVKQSAALKSPTSYIDLLREKLDYTVRDLKISYKNVLDDAKEQLSVRAAKLDAYSPLKTLSRGYSITFKQGEILRSVSKIAENDNIRIRLSDGTVNCTVDSIEKE